MQCQLCGKFGHLVHGCFHRFNVHFTGVIDPSCNSPSTPSVHMSSTEWDDAFEVESSSCDNKPLCSPSRQFTPSSFQSPLPTISPYIRTVYPYMYPTPSLVS